jgi:hypothetical protein
MTAKKLVLFSIAMLLLIVGGLVLVAAPTLVPLYQLMPAALPGPVAAVAVTLPNGSRGWLPLSGTMFQNNANTLGIIFPTQFGPNFADSETPGGTIDGVNPTFTVARPPNPPASLQLFRNGQLMRFGPGNDFTLAGSTVTFLAGAIPQAGDVLTVSYRF